MAGTGLIRTPDQRLSVASDAGDQSSVGYYLQRLAALATQREDPDRAVRLLAAADALLEAAGTGRLLAYVAAAPSGAASGPGCAAGWETNRSSRRGPRAPPWDASLPWSTHYRTDGSSGCGP